MKQYAFTVALLGLSLGACVSSPKETVLNLDTTDKRWTSRECVAARKAVARYDDKGKERGVVGLLGNLAAPFAGTAAALAMDAAQDDEREKLNDQVRKACISDPMGKRGGG
ncbi:hypothetical protein [Caulobacter sp. 17J80-11]|uniref:hypothetical protein n=1 Tax=Caulobacter sp. 17J80-11 TaxID=2763502 RepID=UPI001653E3A3|nr:hypothetical protein [Caulobacter sp. 17J80-11]MBC6981261.1 hypothetical protein [Caulobacter sp. 17J80-11]